MFHVTVIITMIIVSITTIQKRNYEFNCSREILIDSYEKKMIEKEKENIKLKETNDMLSEKIDSLKKIKQQITLKYDTKIDSIFDASADEHARWLKSTIKGLSRDKIR